MNSLEELLLETLSFFDPMNKEQIIIQLDSQKILDDELVNMTMEDLEALLNLMIKQGKVKKGKNDAGDVTYIKILPQKRRSIWQRLLLRFFGVFL